MEGKGTAGDCGGGKDSTNTDTGFTQGTNSVQALE